MKAKIAVGVVTTIFLLLMYAGFLMALEFSSAAMLFFSGLFLALWGYAMGFIIWWP